MIPSEDAWASPLGPGVVASWASPLGPGVDSLESPLGPGVNSLESSFLDFSKLQEFHSVDPIQLILLGILHSAFIFYV